MSVPVLQVFVPDGGEVRERLLAACAAVSEALGLPPDGVIATHVPVGRTVRGGADAPVWPVVVVHGSARDRAMMDRALDNLTAVARSWSDGEPWVTWQLPA